MGLFLHIYPATVGLVIITSGLAILRYERWGWVSQIWYGDKKAEGLAPLRPRRSIRSDMLPVGPIAGV